MIQTLVFDNLLIYEQYLSLEIMDMLVLDSVLLKRVLKGLCVRGKLLFINISAHSIETIKRQSQERVESTVVVLLTFESRHNYHSSIFEADFSRNIELTVAISLALFRPYTIIYRIIARSSIINTQLLAEATSHLHTNDYL